MQHLIVVVCLLVVVVLLEVVRGQNCQDFQEGACPLTEGNIIQTVIPETSPSLCQDRCRSEISGRCTHFTHFEDQCYLLQNCDSLTSCVGCVSGPINPDLDDCPWPPVPGSTTLNPVPTTSEVDCSGFQSGYICHSNKSNKPDHIKHIANPAECQALCQERSECAYFSHYHEWLGRHEGHCLLFRRCSMLDVLNCRSPGSIYCPRLISDAEHISAEEDPSAALNADENAEKVENIKCSCISGPQYPDISYCNK